MSERTQGKWYVHPDNRTFIVTASNQEVADTSSRDWLPDEQRANAAFIVKAVNAHDQLLEALKLLLREEEAGTVCNIDRATAYAAIAAAEGK